MYAAEKVATREEAALVVKVDVVVEASHFHAGGCAITLSKLQSAEVVSEIAVGAKANLEFPLLVTVGAGVLQYRPGELVPDSFKRPRVFERCKSIA